MAGYLNQNLKDSLRDAIFSLHDSLSMEIFVFQNSKKTLISTNNLYNSIYSRNSSGENTNVQYETVKHSFYARVYYTEEDQDFLSVEGSQENSQNKIILKKISAKIIVKKDCYLILKESRRVELDGVKFSIKSEGINIGRFCDLYSFNLTAID